MCTKKPTKKRKLRHYTLSRQISLTFYKDLYPRKDFLQQHCCHVFMFFTSLQTGIQCLILNCFVSSPLRPQCSTSASPFCTIFSSTSCLVRLPHLHLNPSSSSSTTRPTLSTRNRYGQTESEDIYLPHLGCYQGDTVVVKLEICLHISVKASYSLLR